MAPSVPPPCRHMQGCASAPYLGCSAAAHSMPPMCCRIHSGRTLFTHSVTANLFLEVRTSGQLCYLGQIICVLIPVALSLAAKDMGDMRDTLHVVIQVAAAMQALQASSPTLLDTDSLNNSILSPATAAALEQIAVHGFQPHVSTRRPGASQPVAGSSSTSTHSQSHGASAPRDTMQPEASVQARSGKGACKALIQACNSPHRPSTHACAWPLLCSSLVGHSDSLTCGARDALVGRLPILRS